MSNEIVQHRPTFSLAPTSIKEALELAEMMSKSNLVPKEFINNPGNIIVAIQWGLELGLQAMQAMQNIAVINGRPSLWGDAVLAIVLASPVCEYVVEDVTDAGASCKVKRKGGIEQVRYFTVEDAKKAGLWGKQGPWTQYPKRMLQMRARSWAVRDVFPDVLRGMAIAEELQDMPDPSAPNPSGQNKEKEVGGEVVYGAYPDDKFSKNKGSWQEAILAGKKTPDEVIVSVNTRAASDSVQLTVAQENEIKGWKSAGSIPEETNEQETQNDNPQS